MKNFIINKFVKNPDDLKSPETRESYGKVAGGVGIVSNLIVCIFKILVGLVFSSISILADGINNLTDASASLITLLGFKLSGRKPDKKHPYGHGRTEYFTALIVSVMIVVIGVSLLKSSIEKTINPEALDFSWLSVVVLAVSIGIKLWQAGFNKSVGTTIHSDALIATAADSKNDVISTSAVLVSLIISKLVSYNLDGPVGILVALFILYSGFSLIKETIAPLMGQAPDPELVENIGKLVMEGQYVSGIHDLIVHDYGPSRVFASIHAEVDSSVDVFLIHDDIDNLEAKCYKDYNVLLTIHMDPVDLNDPEVAKVSDILHGIAKETEGVFNVHDVRLVPGPTHTNVVFDCVRDYDCKYTNDEIEEIFQKSMKNVDKKYICVVTVDSNFV